MVTGNGIEPDEKDAGARLFSEIHNAYSKERLIAYWEGRLGNEESETLYREILHNPDLRNRLADIVEELLDDSSDARE